MNDERNNKRANFIKNNESINKNSISRTIISNSDNNNSRERLIAEAAKIFIKNGITGASANAVAAAAEFLNVTTNVFSFQPPALPLYTYSTTTSESLSLPSNKNLNLEQKGNHLTAGRALHRTRVESFNNGLSLRTKGSSSSISSSADKKQNTVKYMATIATKASTTSLVHECVGTRLDAKMNMASDCGVIDYTLNNIRNPNNKNIYEPNHDVNKSHIAGLYGGRLQFFKDGKFILELARAKEGEKSGWVSVPRKPFRSPSTISSTITPTSAGSLMTYPKNESSTSLSFSDDNSSLQSSPWQRDHCWKQTAPKRHYSMEMSLYYYRPTSISLTRNAFKMTQLKRRQPHNKAFLCIGLKIFESFKQLNTNNSSADKTNMNEKSFTKATFSINESVKFEGHIKHDVELNNEISKIQNDHVSHNDSDKESKDIKNFHDENGVIETTTSQITKLNTSKDVLKTDEINIEKEKNNISCNEIDSKPNNDETTLLEFSCSPNTSEDVGAEEQTLLDKNINTLNSNGCNDKLEGKKKNLQNKNELILKKETCISIEDTNDGREIKKRQRLKVFKNRAKLETIVRQLNQRNNIIFEGHEQNQQLKILTSTTTTNLADACSKISGNDINSRYTLQNKACTATTTATRLMVDSHQQHISPRKRILREFEKVSLEDNGILTTNMVGGKRIRAKTLSATTSATALTTTTTTKQSSNSPTFNKLDRSHERVASNTPTTPVNKTTNSITTSTRLYSSYSIHSILGGENSSRRNSYNNNINKYLSNTSHQTQCHHTQQGLCNVAISSPGSSQERDNLLPPSPTKSPDVIHISTNTNRNNCAGSSPPYVAFSTSSPLSDVHSHSPITMKTTAIINSHQYHNYQQQQQQDQMLEKQIFHAPYMVSLKTATASRQHATEVVSTLPTPLLPSTTTTLNNNIPIQHISVSSSSTSSSSSSSSLSPQQQQHSSHHQIHRQQPQHLSSDHIAAPTRHTNDYTTQRNVPKQAAPIRRQFESPTTSSPSPKTTIPGCNDDKSVGLLSAAQQQHLHNQQQHQHWLHHNNTNAGSGNHVPLHHYMYPPAPTVQPPTDATSNVINSSTSGTVVTAAAAAAAAAAYIPYYHPYFTTLAALRQSPLWMHHYSGVMIPHHPPPPQLPSSHHLISSVCNTNNNHKSNSSNSSFLINYHNKNISMGRMSHKLATKNVEYPVDPTTATTIKSNNTAKSTNHNDQSTHINKEEHSSDLPLNLSKH